MDLGTDLPIHAWFHMAVIYGLDMEDVPHQPALPPAFRALTKNVQDSPGIRIEDRNFLT